MAGAPGEASEYDKLCAISNDKRSKFRNALSMFRHPSIKELAAFMESDGYDEMDTPDALKASGLELRNYQRQVLCWMVRREQSPMCSSEPFITRGEFAGGRKYTVYRLRVLLSTVAVGEYWYNAKVGWASLTKPTSRGGILADEMGMGKTVEIMALVAANPSEITHEAYVFPGPMGDVAPSKRKKTAVSTAFARPTSPSIQTPLGTLPRSRATLVVVPVTLLEQWANEIRAKAPSLVLMMYHGPDRSNHKFFPYNMLTPDIVLTSYTMIVHDRSTRSDRTKGRGKKGKEKAVSTDAPEDEKLAADAHGPDSLLFKYPLEYIHWHRIVVDESHTLKQSETQTSKLCRKLSSSLRWCCTGTPMQTKVEDLIGQLQFINLVPITSKGMFESYRRHCGLAPLLQATVMRHTKSQKIGRPLCLSERSHCLSSTQTARS